MKKEQTELLDYIINPSFLEQIKQSNSSIAIPGNFSFEMERNGRTYHVAMYAGKEGQVNIWTVNKYNMMDRVIIQDFCKNMNDFVSLFDKLDDLATRMPNMD